MHSLYLSHLVEIANGSRHALAINSRIFAAFCVLPVYNQLLAPAHVATNTTAIPSTIGAHDPLVVSGCRSQDLSYKHAKLYENLTCVRKRPAAIALNYSVHDIQNGIH